MTDKAVSALTSLTGANAATGDLLYIVDISEAAAADRSKKITAEELQNYIKGFPATIGVGGATPAASGAGVSFPATVSLSSNANTLDDYEEGSWTPAINFGGASTGLTYSAQVGRYTKIGNVVFVQGSVQMTNKGSATGNASLVSLPFTVAGAIAGFYPCLSVNAFNLDTTRQVVLQVNYADSPYLIEFKLAGTDTNMNDSQFTNTTAIRFMFFYQTNQ